MTYLLSEGSVAGIWESYKCDIDYRRESAKLFGKENDLRESSMIDFLHVRNVGEYQTFNKVKSQDR